MTAYHIRISAATRDWIWEQGYTGAEDDMQVAMRSQPQGSSSLVNIAHLSIKIDNSLPLLRYTLTE
jgi:hypothetical protein